MSTAVFNRFIGSDRHVYFKVFFKRKNDHHVGARSEYGSAGVVLKKEAARRMAFISPFIMYISELHGAAAVLDAPLAAQYKKENTAVNDGELAWVTKWGQVGSPELVRQIQPLLGQLDLTVEDAERVLKAFTIKKLHDLYERNQVRYQSFMDILKYGSFDDVSELLNAQVLSPLGYSSGFEGRVPVAVPPEDLVHFNLNTP
jgi:hypothetical protein